MWVPNMISQMWNIIDVCWATAKVSAREEGFVCLLHLFIGVVVPVEGLMDVQT
jgi:hypothetical protein